MDNKYCTQHLSKSEQLCKRKVWLCRPRTQLFLTRLTLCTNLLLTNRASRDVPYRRLHHKRSLSTQAPYGLKHVDCPVQLDSLKCYINCAKRPGTTATITGKRKRGREKFKRKPRTDPPYISFKLSDSELLYITTALLCLVTNQNWL